MTKLLVMLKRVAAAYPRLKRSAGYPPFQQTRGYAAASTSVLAFALILLALDQRRNQLYSISKDMDEVVQKMEHLTEVMRQIDHGASTALGSDDEQPRGKGEGEDKGEVLKD